MLKKIIQYIDRLHLDQLSLKIILCLLRHTDIPVIGKVIRVCGNLYTRHIIHGETLVVYPGFLYNQDHSFNHQHTVIDHSSALRMIQREKDLCVIDCMCRTISKNCESPLKTCILVGPEARRRNKIYPDQRLTAEQARDLLHSCFDKNLIHNAIYVLGVPVEICNCCRCCCLPILGVKKGFNSLHPSGYIAVKSEGIKCLLCGKCEAICPFGAVANGRINPERCYGCGLCAYKCPQKAITMIERVSKHQFSTLRID